MKEQLSKTLEKLNEMEQLREKLKASKSRIEAELMDMLTITQKLHEQEEAMTDLIQERDYLKDKLNSLQAERDLISKEMQEAKSMVQQIRERSLELAQVFESKEEQSQTERNTQQQS
ncbi:Hypothetical predicted protein [Podarcis lilfordi]|uniref:Uncharacterized protein n=1 Tax=Podarcis lilfordi TaxID=74358 RepID=A0AA35LD29_9SAUR|nr:Hypothetical predicted protein [Podarcis lilfordi]